MCEPSLCLSSICHGLAHYVQSTVSPSYSSQSFHISSVEIAASERRRERSIDEMEMRGLTRFFFIPLGLTVSRDSPGLWSVPSPTFCNSFKLSSRLCFIRVRGSQSLETLTFFFLKPWELRTTALLCLCFRFGPHSCPTGSKVRVLEGLLELRLLRKTKSSTAVFFKLAHSLSSVVESSLND